MPRSTESSSSWAALGSQSLASPCRGRSLLTTASATKSTRWATSTTWSPRSRRATSSSPSTTTRRFCDTPLDSTLAFQRTSIAASSFRSTWATTPSRSLSPLKRTQAYWKDHSCVAISTRMLTTTMRSSHLPIFLLVATLRSTGTHSTFWAAMNLLKSTSRPTLSEAQLLYKHQVNLDYIMLNNYSH